MLDLGSHSGSFNADPYPLRVIRLDCERPSPLPAQPFVQADAAHLPFRAETFDAVVSNHSLEHMEQWEMATQEIGAVLKPDGKLYLAVPDSTTLTDRLYRWLARGGGHVNRFSSVETLGAKIERQTGKPLAGVRTLCTSLSFLNRRNLRTRAPRRLWLLGGGQEKILVFLTYLFRLLDRHFHTRLSLYGWVLYFGEIGEPIGSYPWTNVCVRCGSGHPSAWLKAQGVVRRNPFFGHSFRCPQCEANNLFTEDADYSFLR